MTVDRLSGALGGAITTMSEYAILVDGVITAVPDVLTWARWFENSDRRIAFTEVDGVRISTVFLGLNHAFRDDVPPLWFETMVFGGEHDEFMQRYTTLEDAMHGHERVVAMVRANPAVG